MLCFIALLLLCSVIPNRAVILWSDSGSTLAHNTGNGVDILEGAVKRDDTSSDTLYFKFHLNPLSDVTTEEYFAALELYEGDSERLGVGNALKAWAYSAFLGHDDVTDAARGGYIDLHSGRPEPAAITSGSSYEFPRREAERTIVFKVQYIAGGDDLVTVWLNPDLGPGANEVYQPETLTTRFNADASFDEIRLRQGGGGEGWIFSDMAIATSFSDFADTSSAKPGGVLSSAGLGTAPLSFRSWQHEQGMPNGLLRALAQTRDGYLWLGSDDGLSRFDGLHFDPVKAPVEIGPVLALLGDDRGALWIGTLSNGLVRYEAGRFSKVAITAPTHEATPITALAQDEQGQVWIGTEKGLELSEDGKTILPDSNPVLKGQSIIGLCKDTNGTMWAAVAAKGIFQLRNGNWTELKDSSIDALLRDPHCLLAARDGRLWIGAGNDFVLCRDGEQWRKYRIPRHSPRSDLMTMAEEPDGTIWVGSMGEGLFHFKGGRFTAVNAASGLADNLVTALLMDSKEKLWVSTESGLSRLQRKNVFVLGQNEGLGYGAVRGIAEVAPGVIWAIKPNDGLYRWQGGTFGRLTAAGLSPHDPVIGALLVARDRSCWVACRGGLLHFKDPQAVEDEGRLFALPQLNIISLAEDSKGNIWSGTREGQLWKLSCGKWVPLTAFSQSNAITALLPSADGSVWVGTDGSGLYRFKDETCSHFDKLTGLPSDSICTLQEGSRNTLWIGTAKGGLCRWRDGQFLTFTSREGLPDDTILQIVEDDFGHLWLGSSRGIACISKHELEDLAAGKTSVLYPHIYGRAEGMSSEECATGFFPAGLETKSGLVWFSTLKGAVVIDSRHLPAAPPPPIAAVERVLVDGKMIPGFGDLYDAMPGAENLLMTLRIPPGRHGFEFQYTGPDFDAPEQTHFRYQLEGWDPGWVDAGTRRTAFYNYVPPGKYRFHVVAANSEGLWNQAGANVGLIVARHFWQAWWVIASGALAVLVLVGAGARLVEKRKLQWRLRRLEQERALERERTRIAQDLHDQMGAKLCRISFLSEHARRGGSGPGEWQDQITSISDTAREVLHSLDEIVWAVNPHNDTLEHVASYLGQYAQDYFQLTGIECEVDLPAQLPAHPVSSQVRHHLFLAVHEAFTNILKHSRATRSKMAVSCNNSEFAISVEDNGSGMNGDLPKNDEDTSATGDGLANMRQRMADIGGDCRIESQPSHGTRVQFIFPLNKNKINGT